jgi:hypothetical protein
MATVLAPANVHAGTVAEAWSAVYNGPGNRNDQPAAIAVGSDGSIYVAGTSYEVGQLENLMLLKYSPTGDLLWDTIINGPANGADRPRAIALDSQDNILLVGPAWQATAVEETLWKFEPVSGNLLWSHSITGFGPCPTFGECDAAIAVTPNDEILYGGLDFKIVKLSPEGDEIWTRSVQPAPNITLMNDIAVAADGRILCGGIPVGSPDGSGVVAYDADGNFLWSDTQLGNHGAVFGRAHVAFDELGNAIAAFEPETSCGVFGLLLVKYNPAGAVQWITPYHVNPCNSFSVAALAVANSNEIYVTGSLGGSADITTIKFDDDGNVAWERLHDGPLGSTDLSEDIALDVFGNVYVAGTELATDSQDRDMVAISYDPAGNLRWTMSFDGGSTANDAGLAIDLHACSRAYLVGSGWNPPNLDDVFLVAYDQPLPGDLDSDGDSDLADFAILQDHFGIVVGAQPDEGDLDGDGDVDLADHQAFTLCTTGPATQP